MFYRDASRDISTRWRRCSVAFVRGQLENCALLLVSLDELNLRFTTRGIRNHQYIYVYIFSWGACLPFQAILTSLMLASVYLLLYFSFFLSDKCARIFCPLFKTILKILVSSFFSYRFRIFGLGKLCTDALVYYLKTIFEILINVVKCFHVFCVYVNHCSDDTNKLDILRLIIDSKERLINYIYTVLILYLFFRKSAPNHFPRERITNLLNYS